MADDRETPAIPDRLYFRIGDVSELVGVEAYVLRFWESEFPMLQPKKGSTGHREYKRRDVELLLEIKRLLYDEGYTIQGARKAIRDRTRSVRRKRDNSEPPQPQMPLLSDNHSDLRPALAQIRKELVEIAALLRRRR